MTRHLYMAQTRRGLLVSNEEGAYQLFAHAKRQSQMGIVDSNLWDALWQALPNAASRAVIQSVRLRVNKDELTDSEWRSVTQRLANTDAFGWAPRNVVARKKAKEREDGS